MFVADTEEISARQRPSKGLFTFDMPTLKDDAVQGTSLSCLRMRVDKDILVAFAHDLRVKAGNYLFGDNHVIGWVASNVDYIFGQGHRKLIGMDI